MRKGKNVSFNERNILIAFNETILYIPRRAYTSLKSLKLYYTLEGDTLDRR